jgi:hypothetical protein
MNHFAKWMNFNQMSATSAGTLQGVPLPKGQSRSDKMTTNKFKSLRMQFSMATHLTELYFQMTVKSRIGGLVSTVIDK